MCKKSHDLHTYQNAKVPKTFNSEVLKDKYSFASWDHSTIKRNKILYFIQLKFWQYSKFEKCIKSRSFLIDDWISIINFTFYIILNSNFDNILN